MLSTRLITSTAKIAGTCFILFITRAIARTKATLHSRQIIGPKQLPSAA